MSLERVRVVSRDRFNDVLVLLNFITSLEPDNVAVVTPHEVKILRGLFFVHLYGAFEKTLNELVQHVLLKIKGMNPSNCHLIIPFNAISLSRKWKGIKDSGYKDAFTRIAEFLECIEMEHFHEFDETLFASLLQNAWVKSIEEVILAFGASGFSISVDNRTIINELVDKRNAVAHGRESAAVVGERFRCDVLRRRLTDIQTFSNELIDYFENYFENRCFIRPSHRAAYP